MEHLTISLKAARVNARLKATDVAHHFGVTKQTILNWEAGKTVPDHDVALKMAELYKIDIKHIFFGKSITLSNTND